MDKISVKLIKSDDIDIVQQLCMVTRGANKFSTVDEFLDYISKNKWEYIKNSEMLRLPHSKLKRFTDLTYIIAGASRRFLAQLSTHHTGISIMSGSLQYSDWSKKSLEDKFCVPYNILDNKLAKVTYLYQCQKAMELYDSFIGMGIDNDTAGYIVPQGLRNIVIVKVNLEELCYIGQQRLCKRNTDETSYVIGLMCKQAMYQLGIASELFMPSCYSNRCNEGMYTCGKPIKNMLVDEYLIDRFPLLKEQIKNA